MTQIDLSEIKRVLSIYAEPTHWSEYHPELDMNVVELEGGFVPAAKLLEALNKPLVDFISIPKVLQICDAHRGKILAERKQHTKGSDIYTSLSRRLDLLNKLKKEFAIVSDTDQIPLGL